MVVLLHGALGSWDEVGVAVLAFVVLWVAVKIAGRKPAGADDDDEDDLAADEMPADETPKPAEQAKPARRSASRPG